MVTRIDKVSTLTCLLDMKMHNVRVSKRDWKTRVGGLKRLPAKWGSNSRNGFNPSAHRVVPYRRFGGQST